MTLVFLPLVEFSESRLSVRGRKRKNNNNNNPQAEKGPTGEHESDIFFKFTGI